MRIYKKKKKFNQDHAKDNISNLLKNLSVMHKTYLLQGGLTFEKKMKTKIMWHERLRRAALCTIFTILLTLWNSEQKNGLLIKLFCFSSDFDETWWSCSYLCVLQFHQVSSKSDEKQKSFINSPFFCSEFQSVSRIVKIVHSAIPKNQYFSQPWWCPSAPC